MLARLSRLTLVAAALCGTLSTVRAHAILLDPNGGELLVPGTTFTIRWQITVAHDLKDWDLWYSTDGSTGTWIPIAMDLPPGDPSESSIHTYDWTVPATLSKKVRLRLRMDNHSTDYEDISDADSEIGCAPVSVYCVAKTNSCGTQPSISSTGTPSASAPNGFVVRVTETKAGKPGLLLYGDSGPANTPFQGGILCVNPNPLRRTIVLLESQGSAGACDGELSIDMNAFAQGQLGGNPLPSLRDLGARINAQFWARDTAGNSLLSNALEYLVCV